VESTTTLEQLCNELESFQNNYNSQVAALEKERAIKAAIAAMKDCFAKAKEEWSELEQAMEKYTQDHENLDPLLEQMQRAADATEEICNNSAHSSSDDITAAGTAATKTTRATCNLILLLSSNTPSQTALEIIKQAAQQPQNSNVAQRSPFNEEIAWANQVTIQIADWAH
jgi:predicted nuclease with TOPRIM domain